MRKTLFASAAALAILAGAAMPAQADVFVTANVNYDKTKDVYINVDKEKIIVIDVDVDVETPYAAEADAVVNQRNDHASVSLDNSDTSAETGSPLGDRTLTALLRGAVSGNAGITQVNQDVGYNVNQANVVSVAFADDAGFANALSAVEQTTNGGSVSVTGDITTDPLEVVLLKSATIVSSVNENAGITQVNQNVGAVNNQANTVSIGVGDNAGAVALSEADLGQHVSGTHVNSVNTLKTSTMNGSVNNNGGITTVNQTAGNFNNQSTTISISGTINTGGPTTTTR